jgi:isocitrate dehydrogenase
MTSLLMSPDGKLIESETAHGTVARHYRKWLQDGEEATNPVATVFAWTRGLAHRGRLDGTPDVETFCTMAEKACVDVVEAGHMTKDLAGLVGPEQPFLSTTDFIDTVAAEIRRGFVSSSV